MSVIVGYYTNRLKAVKGELLEVENDFSLIKDIKTGDIKRIKNDVIIGLEKKRLRLDKSRDVIYLKDTYYITDHAIQRYEERFSREDGLYHIKNMFFNDINFEVLKIDNVKSILNHGSESEVIRFIDKDCVIVLNTDNKLVSTCYRYSTSKYKNVK